MALITCPQCGQSVSDSAQTCIHCGYKLKKEPENFLNLPVEKQEKLKNEYSLSHSGQKLENFDEISAKFLWARLLLTPTIMAILLLGVSFLLIASLYYADIIYIILSCISFLLCGVCIFLLMRSYAKYKATKEKQLIYHAEFEGWLKKNYNMSVNWDLKNKDYLEYERIKQNRGIK